MIWGCVKAIEGIGKIEEIGKVDQYEIVYCEDEIISKECEY